MRKLIFCAWLSAIPLAAHAELPRVVFVGSSSLVYWKSLEDDFKDIARVKNLGVGGTDYLYMFRDVKWTDKSRKEAWPTTYHDARKVIIYSGDNDTAGSASAEEVAQNFVKAVEEIRQALPKAELHVLSIKPSVEPSRAAMIPKIEQANRMIEAAARRADVGFVEVHAPMRLEDGKADKDLFLGDGFHMKPESYAIWKAMVRPVVSGCDQAPAIGEQYRKAMEVMYKLHLGIPAARRTPRAANELLQKLAKDFEHSCGDYAALKPEVDKIGFSNAAQLSEDNKQTNAHAAILKNVDEVEEKIFKLRQSLQKKFQQLDSEARSFRQRTVQFATLVLAKDPKKERREQLIREAHGGGRLAALAARKVLSVDYDLSLLSDQLRQYGETNLKLWARNGNGESDSAYVTASAELKKDAAAEKALDLQRGKL